MAVAGHVADRHRGQIIVLDLTAGPGEVDGAPGSPSIIADVLHETGRPARVWFFERDGGAASLLRDRATSWMERDRRQVFHVVEADHAEGVPWFIAHELPNLSGPLYGLVYVDANRRTHLSFDALNLLATTPRLRSVDILLNVAATSWWKRIRAVGKSQRFFYDDIRGIPKMYRWFRRPVGPPQWTMIFLSNYPKWSPSKQAGFFAEHSEAGREIVERLNLSKPERQASLQLMLPFGDAAVGDREQVRKDVG